MSDTWLAAILWEQEGLITMKRKFETDILFLLFAVLIFLSSVFLVLTYGTGAYGAVKKLSAENANDKLILSLVSTKIRQADEKDALSVISFGGQNAICIKEEYDGFFYQTLIYEYGGYVRELFFESSQSETPEEAGFLPADGQELFSSGTLNLKLVSPKLLLIELQENNTIRRLYAGQKSEGQWSDG